MNKNAIIGLALVAFAVALSCVLAGSVGEATKGLLGKAVWYLPYAAFVGGVRNLFLARR